MLSPSDTAYPMLKAHPFAIEHFQPLHVKRAIENGRCNCVGHLGPEEMPPANLLTFVAEQLKCRRHRDC
jgi:hypothetical protein